MDDSHRKIINLPTGVSVSKNYIDENILAEISEYDDSLSKFIHGNDLAYNFEELFGTYIRTDDIYENDNVFIPIFQPCISLESTNNDYYYLSKNNDFVLKTTYMSKEINTPDLLPNNDNNNVISKLPQNIYFKVPYLISGSSVFVSYKNKININLNSSNSSGTYEPGDIDMYINLGNLIFDTGPYKFNIFRTDSFQDYIPRIETLDNIEIENDNGELFNDYTNEFLKLYFKKYHNHESENIRINRYNIKISYGSKLSNVLTRKIDINDNICNFLILDYKSMTDNKQLIQDLFSYEYKTLHIDKKYVKSNLDLKELQDKYKDKNILLTEDGNYIYIELKLPYKYFDEDHTLNPIYSFDFINSMLFVSKIDDKYYITKPGIISKKDVYDSLKRIKLFLEDAVELFLDIVSPDIKSILYKLSIMLDFKVDKILNRYLQYNVKTNEFKEFLINNLSYNNNIDKNLNNMDISELLTYHLLNKNYIDEVSTHIYKDTNGLFTDEEMKTLTGIFNNKNNSGDFLSNIYIFRILKYLQPNTNINRYLKYLTKYGLKPNAVLERLKNEYFKTLIKLFLDKKYNFDNDTIKEFNYMGLLNSYYNLYHNIDNNKENNEDSNMSNSKYFNWYNENNFDYFILKIKDILHDFTFKTSFSLLNRNYKYYHFDNIVSDYIYIYNSVFKLIKINEIYKYINNELKIVINNYNYDNYKSFNDLAEALGSRLDVARGNGIKRVEREFIEKINNYLKFNMQSLWKTNTPYFRENFNLMKFSQYLYSFLFYLMQSVYNNLRRNAYIDTSELSEKTNFTYEQCRNIFDANILIRINILTALFNNIDIHIYDSETNEIIKMDSLTDEIINIINEFDTERYYLIFNMESKYGKIFSLFNSNRFNSTLIYERYSNSVGDTYIMEIAEVIEDELDIPSIIKRLNEGDKSYYIGYQITKENIESVLNDFYGNIIFEHLIKAGINIADYIPSLYNKKCIENIKLKIEILKN